MEFDIDCSMGPVGVDKMRPGIEGLAGKMKPGTEAVVAVVVGAVDIEPVELVAYRAGVNVAPVPRLLVAGRAVEVVGVAGIDCIDCLLVPGPGIGVVGNIVLVVVVGIVAVVAS